MVSYTQAFAVLESLFVYLVVILLGLLLPKRMLRDQWAAKGAVFVFVTSLWTISYHYLQSILVAWQGFFEMIVYKLGLGFSKTQLLSIGIAVFGVMWIMCYVLTLRWNFRYIRHRPAYVKVIRDGLDRLAPLAYLYLGFGVFGGLVVLLRNLV